MFATRAGYISRVIFLFGTLFLAPIAAQSQDTSQTNNPTNNLASTLSVIIEANKSLDARWQGLPAGEKAISYAKRLTPLYSWIVLCDAVDDASFVFLMGDCLKQQTDALWQKWFNVTDAQVAADYRAVTDRLWARNPLDAIKFARAMRDQSSDGGLNDDLWPACELLVALFLVFLATGRTGLLVRVAVLGFLASIWIWLFGPIVVALPIASRIESFVATQADDLATRFDPHTVIVTGSGATTLLLGVALLFRWVWWGRLARPVQRGADNAGEKWNALLRYDDEIARAAQALRPYGQQWIDEFGRAFFALGEDRGYLDKIVQRLLVDAKQSSPIEAGGRDVV
jgi:hypothetical protein